MVIGRRGRIVAYFFEISWVERGEVAGPDRALVRMKSGL
jgi:hypothetical protein